MSQEAFATIAGYATADPTFRLTKGGAEVAHIRVACTPRRIDRLTGEWKDGDTSYFSVTCWRKLAIAVKASIRKGDPVLVRGRFRTRTWQNEERTVTELEIEADAMGHDLTLGWAVFQKDRRAMQGVAAGLGSGETARQLPGPDEGEEVPDGSGPVEDGGGNWGRDQTSQRSYAGTNPGDPDEGDPGAVAADADPRAPIAPALASLGTDILAEPVMAELSEELDEAVGISVPA